MSGSDGDEIGTDPIGDDGGSSATGVLSTGIENLDDVIRDQGIREGSIIVVKGEASSRADIFTTNMIAKRPAYYFTLGKDRDTVHTLMTEISNVNTDYISLQSVDLSQPLEDLRQRIHDADSFPTGASIIINPANEIEKRKLSRYRELLDEVREIAKEANGLVIINAIESSDTPQNRWFTEHYADIVFNIKRYTNEEEVSDMLSIQKFHPLQELAEEGERVFELNWDLDIDIATSRSISP